MRSRLRTTRMRPASGTRYSARPTAANLHNEDVAAALDEMAELLAIRGDNPFRVRAYQRAAQVVRTLPRPLAELGGPEAFDALPGIGPDLAGKLAELLRTGRLGALERLRREVPAGLRELLRLPGLGPVRVRALHAALGVRSPDDLRRRLEQGPIRGVRGFGPTLQARLRAALAATAAAAGQPRRWPRALAAQYAEPLRDHLRNLGGVESVEIAGSYRRGRDTVGDLDLIVVAREDAGLDLAAALRRYADVVRLVAAGPTRCTAMLRNGLQADLRVVPPGSAGAALQYFTGSREHNLRLRRRAQERGLKLNEYGLFRGGRPIAGATEQDVLAALGLPWIAPELREDRGEIDAAERGALPQLVERADLAGDLHVHTSASDGRDSLDRMAQAAQARGLAYLAITDHSRYLGALHGLDAGRLSAQIDAIDTMNASLRGLTLLKGIEVDVLADGSLAMPDAVLARLDVVVAAIHGQFGLDARRQTTRILRALEHPYLTILAHPRGRLIGEREPIAFDLERVLEAARARPCYVELNAQPSRLDLDDLQCRAAAAHGVLVSIASDAHDAGELDYAEGGILQARRAWLTARQVLNAQPLPELRRLLRRTRLA